jgi:hypothetical protein
MAYNLRFATEKLLNTILQNSKSVADQVGPLGNWVKNKGFHPQFTTMLKQFAEYQDNAVKHPKTKRYME